MKTKQNDLCATCDRQCKSQLKSLSFCWFHPSNRTRKVEITKEEKEAILSELDNIQQQ